jgi:hypothetical protein
MLVYQRVGFGFRIFLNFPEVTSDDQPPIRIHSESCGWVETIEKTIEIPWVLGISHF